MVAWGNRRNEAIISAEMVSLAAMAANDCDFDFPGAIPIAWHSTHHRSDSRRPFSMFWADAAVTPPDTTSAMATDNGWRQMFMIPGRALTAAHHRLSMAARTRKQYPRRRDRLPRAGRGAPRAYPAPW